MPAFDDNSSPSVWVRVPVPTPMSSKPSAPAPAPAPAAPPPTPTWNAPPMLLLPHTPSRQASTAPVRMSRRGRILGALRVRLEKDKGSWVTIGGHGGHGGGPVFIKDGVIEKGAPGLKGKTMESLMGKDHPSSRNREEVKAAGHDPRHLAHLTSQIQSEHNEHAAEVNEMLKHAREYIANEANRKQKNLGDKTKGAPNFASHQDKHGDHINITGFDLATEDTVRLYPHLFKKETGENGSHEDQLYEYLTAGNRKMMTHQEAHDKAFNHLMSEEPHKGGDTDDDDIFGNDSVPFARERFKRPLPSWVPKEEEGNEADTGWVATPESSWIAGLKHTEGGTAMTVKKGGKTYNYPGLDLSRFRAWLKAKSKGKFWWANVGRVMRQSRDGSPAKLSRWNSMPDWDPRPGARQNRDIEGLAQGYAENPGDDARLGALTDALEEAGHPHSPLFQWYWHHGRDAFRQGYENADFTHFDAFVHPWNLYELHDLANNIHENRPEVGNLLMASMRRHLPEDYTTSLVSNTPARTAHELAAMGLHSAIPPDPDRDYAKDEWRRAPFHAYSRVFNHVATKHNLPVWGEDHLTETHPEYAHEMFRHASGMQEFAKSMNHHLHQDDHDELHNTRVYRWKGQPEAEPAKMARRGTPVRFQSEDERDALRNELNQHPELQSLVKGYLENPEDRQRQGIIADWMMDNGHPDADRLMWYHKHGGPAFEQAFKAGKRDVIGPPIATRLENEARAIHKVPDLRIRPLLNAAYYRADGNPAHEAFAFLNSAGLPDGTRFLGNPVHLAKRHEQEARLIAEGNNDNLPLTHRGRRSLPPAGHEHELGLWEEHPGYSEHMEPAVAGFKAFRQAIEKHANTGYEQNFKLKYSAMRAPAGGAIVRGIYQPGGQALPAEAGAARPKASPRFSRLVAKLKAKRRV